MAEEKQQEVEEVAKNNEGEKVMPKKAQDEAKQAVAAKQAIPESEKKPLKKFGTQEEHEVEGVTYTFQFPGIRRATQILDHSKMMNGVVSDEAYNQQLMSDVIVDPKVDWEYWEEHNGYREVMDKADTFLGSMLS